MLYNAILLGLNTVYQHIFYHKKYIYVYIYFKHTINITKKIKIYCMHKLINRPYRKNRNIIFIIITIANIKYMKIRT